MVRGTCTRCGSTETPEASHKTMPCWCKSCHKYFSVKTGIPLEKSNISYHKMSVKHLQRDTDEFCDRYNVRQLDTMEQIKATVAGFVGKKLKYKELTA